MADIKMNIINSDGKIGMNVSAQKIYPPLENLEATPSGVEQVFTHPNSYGYDTVTVERVEADTLNITPTTESQEYTGLYGTVNVGAVDNSIDSDIKAENIKQGINILGVTGNVEELNGEEITVKSSETEQIILPSENKNAFTKITVEPLGQEAEEKYINFYDYDGTRLYSYTKQEIQTLQELPPVPVVDGYTITWNWTLPQIKSQNKPVDVGALYSSNDGKLKITMVFSDDTFDTPSLVFSMKRTSGNLVATIDWGDGTSEVVTATGNTTKNIPHTYTNIQAGKPYIITLEQTNCKIIFENAVLAEPYRRFITDIDTGNITTYGYQTFAGAMNLKTVKMNSEAELSSYSFGGASVLGFCVVPYVTGVTLNRVFQITRLYKGISLPYGMTSIGDYAFDGASIRHLYIPNTVTSIGSNAFRGCANLTSIVLPSSITSIGTNAFNSSSYLKEIDLSEYTDPTTIPTLSNSNAFSIIYSDSVFLVANQEMLTAFSGATNWSTYATKFQVKGS